MGVSIRFNKQGFLGWVRTNKPSAKWIKINIMVAMGMLKYVNWLDYLNDGWHKKEMAQGLEPYAYRDGKRYYEVEDVGLLTALIGSFIFVPVVVFGGMALFVLNILISPLAFLYYIRIVKR